MEPETPALLWRRRDIQSAALSLICQQGIVVIWAFSCRKIRLLSSIMKKRTMNLQISRLTWIMIWLQGEMKDFQRNFAL